MKRFLLGIAAILLAVLAAGCRGNSVPVNSNTSAASPGSKTDGRSLDFSTPEKTLALFCEAVQAGDLELWNELHSKKFLAEHGRFDTVETRPSISARNVSRLSDDQMRNGGYEVSDTYRYYKMELYDGETFIGDGGRFGSCYTLVLEDGGWKIDSVGTSFA